MDDVTESANTSGRGAVAAAVITSRSDVLVGRRWDGNPPWVFPAGKIEPGNPRPGSTRSAQYVRR
jgi:8-oxo-dGTP pyrophosphatase MutT (NUDIX family)